MIQMTEAAASEVARLKKNQNKEPRIERQLDG